MKGDKFLSKAFDYYCIHRMSIIVKKIQNPLVEYHTPLSIVTDMHICIHLCCLQSFQQTSSSLIFVYMVNG